MPFQEVIPGVGTSTRTGIKTILFEDPLHRGLRDRPDPEFLQFPEDSPVSPIVLPGKLQHQSANLLRRPTSAATDRKSLSTHFSLFPNPTQHRARGHDRRQLMDRLSDSGSGPDQPPPFARSDRNSAGDLATEDVQFHLHVMELSDQFRVSHRGDGEEEFVKQRCHGASRGIAGNSGANLHFGTPDRGRSVRQKPPVKDPKTRLG